MILSKFNGNLAQVDFLSLLLVDISGRLHSVSLPRSYVTDKVLEEGIGFDASNFGFAQVEQSDMRARPNLETAFVEMKDGYRICHAFGEVVGTDGQGFAQYPREVARSAQDSLAEHGIGDEAKMLVELEFYVFDEVRYSTTFDHSYYYVKGAEGIGEGYADGPRFGMAGGYHRLGPEDKYNLLRNRAVEAMCAIGIPVKYHHHEVGAGQLEIELDFLSLPRAADAVALAEWIIRTCASELGLHVSFMPKPMYKAAGSGLHVHQFIEKSGASIFPGEGLYGLSGPALSYAAGILEHSLSGSLLAWSNPSTNSYRRLVPGYEAPVAASIAQGSRAAAIRVPGYLKKGQARIEFRTGDATANVYYYLAAMLLAGLDGMGRGLDPVKLGFTADTAKPQKAFPTGLYHVLAGLEKDRSYLAPAFPDGLVAHWIDLKKKEAEYVYNAPVPQEYELYF